MAEPGFIQLLQHNSNKPEPAQSSNPHVSSLIPL